MSYELYVPFNEICFLTKSNNSYIDSLCTSKSN